MNSDDLSDLRRAIAALSRARPICYRASRAFDRGGFLWFVKRAGDVIDERAVWGAFVEWLATAPESEIERYLAAMATYRRALRDEAADAPLVLSGDVGRLAWRKTVKLAAHAATVAENKKARAADGRKGACKKANASKPTCCCARKPSWASARSPRLDMR